MTVASAPLLTVLGEVFGLDELASERCPMAAVDNDLTIRWTNRAWHDFALQNGGVRQFGLGDGYLDGIAEPMKSYYRAVFHQALATQEIFLQEYECSSPSVRRLNRLRALPLDGQGLLLEHSAVREEPHGHVPSAARERAYRNEHGLLLQCSNCRRVRRRDGGWDWVPAWVAKVPAMTSHGLCAPCAGLYFHGAAMKTAW